MVIVPETDSGSAGSFESGWPKSIPASIMPKRGRFQRIEHLSSANFQNGLIILGNLNTLLLYQFGKKWIGSKSQAVAAKRSSSCRAIEIRARTHRLWVKTAHTTPDCLWRNPLLVSIPSRKRFLNIPILPSV